MSTNIKQVIVIRKDLNMRKGKIAAQTAHASMAAILNLGSMEYYSDIDDQLTEISYNIPLYKIQKAFNGEDDIDHADVVKWLEGRFTKICVSVDSEKELLAIYKEALDAGIICSLIQDAGLTEFAGVPTYTAVAIGPAKSTDIDKITGDLKLL